MVVAAGASGVALLVAPGSTERYFSWMLRPPAAAALIGGFYLASAVAFAWGLTLPGRQARALLVGALGLAVPTLVLTVVHDEAFDFGRWQALAWVALFVTAPLSASLLLVRLGSRDGGSPAGPAVPGWCRAVVGVLGAALLAVAVLVWVDGTRDDVVRASPVDLVGLTGTYLGAWCSFLALLCGHAAVTGAGTRAGWRSSPSAWPRAVPRWLSCARWTRSAGPAWSWPPAPGSPSWPRRCTGRRGRSNRAVRGSYAGRQSAGPTGGTGPPPPEQEPATTVSTTARPTAVRFCRRHCRRPR